MKLTNDEAVKKWMRGLPLMKKELEMKIAFYMDLAREVRKLGEAGEKRLTAYMAQIEQLQDRIKGLARDMERLLGPA